MNKFSVVIPTLNGGISFKALSKTLVEQSCYPFPVIVIDSDSEDETVVIAKQSGFNVIPINKKDFNHGSTRQLAVSMCDDCEVIIFLTQDAILVDHNTIETIISCFKDENIGLAYGRQLPHNNSGLFGAHARLFNYPECSSNKRIEDSSHLGIKTAFASNSFAAYRRDVLISVGGFPSDIILGEDMYVATKMLLAGYSIFYCAKAKVYHSHDYNCLEEFKRYFDIGVFHSRESWIVKSLGKAEGEGIRFVLSELRFLIHNRRISLIPIALIKTFFKLAGYRLGLKEANMPRYIKKYISMTKGFWL